MTIAEKYLGIDLILKILKSEIYGSLQNVDKDYFLNLAILEMIKIKTGNLPNRLRDRDTLQDSNYFVKDFYSELGNLVINKTYNALSTSTITIDLPKIDNVEITSGQLISGEVYKVLERGGVDFTGFAANPTTIIDGSTITITTTGLPIWDNVTTLERISDPFMFTLLSVDINIIEKYYNVPVTIKPNREYFRSYGNFSLINPYPFQSVSSTVAYPIANEKFKSGSGIAGNVTITTPTDITLGLLKRIPLDLLLPSEKTILSLDPNVTKEPSAIGTIANNQLTINSNYMLYDVTISYIKMPRKINGTLNIDTDVSPVLHQDIVKTAVKLIMGTNEKQTQ